MDCKTIKKRKWKYSKMGIRGLTQLANGLKCKKKIPLGHISHERHRIWAIDASLFLYRARCLAANSSSETSFGRTHRRPHRFRNVVGDVPLEKSHLVGIIDVVSQLLANCITPVIVFDGPPPQEKAKTIQKRKTHKEHAQQNIAWIEQQFESDPPPSKTSTPTAAKPLFSNQPTSDEFFERAITQLKSPVGLTPEEKRRIKHELEAEKQKLAAVFLQPHHFYQTQSLCEILGIPFIRSPCEAEVTCVELLRNRKIDAVYTADSDVLVFGCTRMIRRIINDEYIDALDHNFVIQELGVTHEQFVCMCILIGCDFCEALPNQKGFTHVLDMVKSFAPFHPDEFLASFSNKYPEWSQKATRAYELYNQRHPHVIHESLIPTPCIPSDTTLLIQQLKEHLDMDGLYVHRVVEQITQSFETYQQTTRPNTATPLGPPVKAGYVPYVSKKQQKRSIDVRRFRPEETLVEMLTEEPRAESRATQFWSEFLSSAYIWCPARSFSSW
jgi:5'-3' exonuclease